MELTKEYLEAEIGHLFHGRGEKEGINTLVVITFWRREQVDALAKLVGGWEQLTELIADKKLMITMTFANGNEREAMELSAYVKDKFLLYSPYARVAQFEPFKKKEDGRDKT